MTRRPARARPSRATTRASQACSPTSRSRIKIATRRPSENPARRAHRGCRAGFASRGTAVARDEAATYLLPTATRGVPGRDLPEHRLHLLEEALRKRVDLLPRDAGEFLEQLALARGQLPRRLDEHADDLVAATVAVHVRDAAALQPERLARLRPGRDLHLRRALERRHVDLRAERRLREADRHVADDVRPLADEERVLADVEHDVEVARRAAARRGLTLATQLETRAAVDAGRDLDAQLVHAALRAGAA